ncbi:SH3 domain-containing protein [Streptomyces sp. NPDC058045]|uniref:SH3 domain-containing protein n=1 Tax=Streptomyces sp. NPDC058045 TaxID=3346311 RepID=UPI0036EEB01A
MSLRSTTARLGIVAAGGALAALAASGSALAAGGDDHGGSGHGGDGTTTGRVTARSGLLLRDAPTRGSRVVRSEPFNARVSIYCQTKGESVDGNRRWYLLTDGTWAWGSARYIDTWGHSPRWC